MNIKAYTGTGNLLIDKNSISYINDYRSLYRKYANKLKLKEFGDNKVCISFRLDTEYTRIGGEGHAGYNFNTEPTITLEEFKKATMLSMQDKIKLLKI
jgi:hypothetical protein